MSEGKADSFNAAEALAEAEELFNKDFVGNKVFVHGARWKHRQLEQENAALKERVRIATEALEKINGYTCGILGISHLCSNDNCRQVRTLVHQLNADLQVERQALAKLAENNGGER